MIGQRLHLEALDNGETNYWRVQEWPDGGTWLTGFARSTGYQDYKGLGWTVIARRSVDEAFAPRGAAARHLYLGRSPGGDLRLHRLGSGRAHHPAAAEIAAAADRLRAGEIAVIPDDLGTREIRTLSQSIRQLVESLTQQQNALGLMESLAHHDPLTGLPNRTALEKHLPRVQQRSQLGKSSLALLYLDLDGFKPVNDNHGHSVGDQVLREAAARMRASLREGDLVARLGGDEFLMILQVPEGDAAPQALQVALRTLQSLGEPIQLGELRLNIGCSIGGALWPQDSAQLGEALELADQALYRAKHEGRNRVVFHGPQPPQGERTA